MRKHLEPSIKWKKVNPLLRKIMSLKCLLRSRNQQTMYEKHSPLPTRLQNDYGNTKHNSCTQISSRGDSCITFKIALERQPPDILYVSCSVAYANTHLWISIESCPKLYITWITWRLYDASFCWYDEGSRFRMSRIHRPKWMQRRHPQFDLNFHNVSSLKTPERRCPPSPQKRTLSAKWRNYPRAPIGTLPPPIAALSSIIDFLRRVDRCLHPFPSQCQDPHWQAYEMTYTHGPDS